MKTCCNQEDKKSKVQGQADKSIHRSKRCGQPEAVKRCKRFRTAYALIDVRVPQQPPNRPTIKNKKKIANRPPRLCRRRQTLNNLARVYTIAKTGPLRRIIRAVCRAPLINRVLGALWSKNTRYVMTQDHENNGGDVWATREGQESVVAAMEEAFMLGATLPDMGCIVPFGGVVEFIPGR